MGTYNFTIVARDISMNEVVDVVLVNVIDTDLPILSGTSDFSFEFGITSQNVTGTPTDLNPANYELYVNSSLSTTGP